MSRIIILKFIKGMGQMTSKLSKYSELRGEREYFKLLAANAVNRFGDSVDSIAFSLLMYEVTGSASMMALLLTVNYLPTIVLQPIAGALVDRMNKKSVMVWMDFARGAVVAFIVLLLYLDALSTAALFICVALISTLETLRIPAGACAMPALLEKEKYTVGVALNGGLGQVCTVIGLALAGPIVEGLGMEWALAIDMATFFFSGAAIAVLKIKLPPREDAGKVSVRAVARDMGDGLKYLKGSKLLWAITMLGMALNFISSPINTFYTPFVTDNLGGGATLLSAAQLVMVAGVAVGALIVPRLEKIRIRTTATAAGLIFALSGAATPLLLLLPTLAQRTVGLLALNLADGLALGVLNTLYSSQFMIHTDKDFLARTTGVTNSLLMLMSPAGSLMCSAAAAVMTVPQCMFWLSLGCAVLFYIVTRMRAFKEL